MGVNVVLWDGSKTTVSDDQAAKLVESGKAKRETDQERAATANESRRAEDYSGVGNTLAAGATGALNAATMGISGAVGHLVAPQAQEDLLAEHPVAETVGEIAGFAAPTGLLGKGVKGATSILPAGLVGGLSEEAIAGGASKLGTRIVEGATWGGVGHVTAAAVHGDPITVEGAVEGAGIGAILNVGFGVLGDRISGAAGKAKTAIAARKATEAEAKTAAETAAKLESPPPSWDAFVETHEAAQKSAIKANKETLAAAEDYAAATQPDAVNKAIKQFQGQRDEVLSRLMDTRYGKTARAARDAAGEEAAAYTKARTAYDKFTGSTTKFPRALRGFNDAIESVADRYGGVGAEAQAAQEEILGAQLEASAGKGTPEYNPAAPTAEPAPAPERSIQDQFVDVVHDAARKAEKFGDRKAFVSSVFENLPPEWQAQGLDEFKKALAKMRGKFNLSRADLKGAMDEKLVAASEYATKDRTGEFHFITPPEAPAAAAPQAGLPWGTPAATPRPTPGVAQGYGAFDAQMAQPAQEAIAAVEHTGAPASIGEEVRAMRKQLEGIGKMKAAGDVDGAMAEMHSLRDKLSKYTHVSTPDLPAIPAAPEGFSLPPKLGNVDDAQLLSHVATDLDRSANEALAHLRRGDGASALATLSAAEGRVGATEGFGDLVFPDLPSPTPPPSPINPVRLPKSLSSFARMTPGKIAALDEAAARSPEVMEAFQRFAGDMGVTAETPSSLHKALAGHVARMNKLEAQAAAEAALNSGKGDSSWLDLARRKLKRAAEYSAARAGDIGGWKGALTRTAAGGAMGYALDGTEGAILGSSFMSGKLGLRAKIQNVVSKLGGVGAAMGRLAPVTSYLGGRLPDGTPDESTDIRQQAANRINDLLTLKGAAADASYSAIEPILGAPGDMAWKVHNHTVNAVSHLADSLPKDPGIDVTPSGSKWVPDHTKSVELAHRIEAVVNPLDAIRRSIAGDGHPAATETLWAVWPAMMTEAASEMAMLAPTLDISYEQGSNLSQLFRVPVTGLQEPAVIVALQGLYLPQPTPQGGQPKSGTPGAPGRPAAVNSRVAGSNVSALTA